jgi:hypothetical protein
VKWAQSEWYGSVSAITQSLGMDWAWLYQRIEDSVPFMNHIGMRGRGARVTTWDIEVIEDHGTMTTTVNVDPHVCMHDHGSSVTDPFAGPPLPYQWSVWAYDRLEKKWLFIVYTKTYTVTQTRWTKGQKSKEDVFEQKHLRGKLMRRSLDTDAVSIRVDRVYSHTLTPDRVSWRTQPMFITELVRGRGGLAWMHTSMDTMSNTSLGNPDIESVEYTGTKFMEPWTWTPSILGDYVQDMKRMYTTQEYAELTQPYREWDACMDAWTSVLNRPTVRSNSAEVQHMVQAVVACYEHVVQRVRRAARN